MTPLLPIPGIQLGAQAQAAAFCETSQRAVLRLVDGRVVAIDASGALHEIGRVGMLPAGMLMCDRRDRIVVAAGRQLVVLANGAATSLRLPADAVHARVLADGAVGVVVQTGVVYRYTTRLAEAWRAGRPVLAPVELDGTGERLVRIAAGRIEVSDRGGHRAGPNALSATWIDDSTVAFSDRTGLVARWPIDAPPESFAKLTRLESPSLPRFVRVLLQRAGHRRVLAQLGSGPLHALALDGPGATLTRTTLVSRLPPGGRLVAAGGAFAVVAVRDRAVIVDLARGGFASPPHLPLVPPEAIAFSPDGRALAMLGGDGDVIITALDRSTSRRLTTTGFVRGPLRWAPDGTVLASTPGNQVRWRLDGSVDVRRERAVGFTPMADPITVTRDLRVHIERGPFVRTVQLQDRTFGVLEADASDRHLLLRGLRRVEIRALADGDDAPAVVRTRDRQFLRAAALVGRDQPRAMFVDSTGDLVLADRTSERILDRVTGMPLLATSPDRARVAIAAARELSVWDAAGRRVARVTTGADIVALAWSPDLRTLAAATRDGIELWTFPR